VRTGRSAEILNNSEKYHTSMLRMDDCNLCASSLTKYKRESSIRAPSINVMGVVRGGFLSESKFQLSSSASDKVEVENEQSSLHKKPSNIPKYLGREGKDSHSFDKRGGRRNYSTSLRTEG
jgi:hypothetical protein